MGKFAESLKVPGEVGSLARQSFYGIQELHLLARLGSGCLGGDLGSSLESLVGSFDLGIRRRVPEPAR